MQDLKKPSDGLQIGADAARGGVTGHNVRYVLATGLLAVVTAFIVVGALS